MSGAHDTPPRKITILPTGQQFAVVRMDPVSMVSHLHLDATALEEATAMKPKKYLVYLDTPQDLPFPTSEWCRYWVEPVATTLRPAVPEMGITSDMIIPIYPNTQHAKGRKPVHSTPQFPFPGCYFWIESTMSLRIPVKRGAQSYDNEHSTTVSISEQVEFESAWDEDSLRMFSLRRASAASKAAEGLPQAARPQHDTRHLTLPPTPSIPPSLRGLPVNSSSADDEEDEEDFTSDASSRESDRSSSPTSDGGTESAPAPKLPPGSPLMELAISMDVFGWTFDPKVPFIPLVDVWFELEDHLSPDTIPSPTELWMEQEKIGAIIEAALKRRAAAAASPQALISRAGAGPSEVRSSSHKPQYHAPPPRAVASPISVKLGSGEGRHPRRRPPPRPSRASQYSPSPSPERGVLPRHKNSAGADAHPNESPPSARQPSQPPPRRNSGPVPGIPPSKQNIVASDKPQRELTPTKLPLRPALRHKSSPVSGVLKQNTVDSERREGETKAPRVTFASLLQSADAASDYIASWGLRSPFTSSQPSSAPPSSNSLAKSRSPPQSGTAPRKISPRGGGGEYSPAVKPLGRSHVSQPSAGPPRSDRRPSS